MNSIKLADAKARLSELVDRVQSGEAVNITRHGKPVACLTPAAVERRPIVLGELQALTKDMPLQSDNELMRKLRDESRY